MTFDVGNPRPRLGQAHKCYGVKSIENVILRLTGGGIFNIAL
jgi:hypothetical protein